MTKAFNDPVEVERDLMGLYFSYGIGYNYFNLLLPAMAVIFSYSHYTVKTIFLLYYCIVMCLQVFPSILVYKLGFRLSMILYCSIFCLGSLIGYLSEGQIEWVIVARVLQAIGLSVLLFFSKVLTYQLPASSMSKTVFYRVLIYNFSGPGFVAVLGILLHWYSWKLGFVLSGLIFFIMLLWMMLFSREIVITGLVHPFGQLKKAVVLFSNKQLMLFSGLVLLVSCLSGFIGIIYAYILHIEYHMDITYVGLFPVVLAVVSSLAAVVMRLIYRAQSDQLNQKVVRYSIMVNVIVALFFLLANIESMQHWWVFYLASIVWSFFTTLAYMGLTNYLGVLVKQLSNNMEYNILYYFLKGIIPLLMILIWSHYERSDFIVPILILLFSIMSFMLIRLIAWDRMLGDKC